MSSRFLWPLCSLFLAGVAWPQISDVTPTGNWGTPVQHNVNVGPGFINVPGVGPNGRRFEAIHLSLIPQPAANEGLVIAWDARGQSGAGGWTQRWSVLDPSTNPPTVKWNEELQLGLGTGDLFCSGHAWTSDGRLFVAGGTLLYPAPMQPFRGGRLAMLYDPTPTAGRPYGGWAVQTSMAKGRWYPTVTLTGDGKMMVSGGTDNGVGENTYEVFDPPTGAWQVDTGTGNAWFPGPVAGTTPLFGNYPRMHLLSDGQMFMSGPGRRNARVDHVNVPGQWTILQQSQFTRHDGASLLYPRDVGQEDQLRIIGGSNGGHSNALKEMESCLPKQTPANWSNEPSMFRQRVHLNAVTLPDKSITVVGGNIEVGGHPIYWKDAEWLSPSGNWWQLATGASTRDYHSTAVLLPDGKILSASGDNRDWDYQLFSPPYFDQPKPRPSNIQLSSTTLNYFANGGGPYAAIFNALPAGTSIERVVLMAAGTTTHHSDMAQRYVDLAITDRFPFGVIFLPPYNNCAAPNPFHSCAPPGYYMLFFVTNQGVPSNARFVRLQ